MTLAVIIGADPLEEQRGRTLLSRQLDWLRAAGAKEAVLCLSSGAAEARRAVGDGSDFGVRLRFFVQEAPLGTAGFVKALGAASLPEDVLVVTGRPETPAAPLLDAHFIARNAATVAAHACKHEPACPPVVIGPESRLVDLPPRPLVGRYPLGLSPFFVVSRVLMRLVPDGKPSDFVRDVFPAALRAGEPLGAWRAQEAKAGR